jgi:Ankyrin repeat
VNVNGQMPLMHAVAGHEQVVSLLLATDGVDVNSNLMDRGIPSTTLHRGLPRVAT